MRPSFSVKNETPVQGGGPWSAILRIAKPPETLITHIQAHLSATGPDDIVFTEYNMSSVRTTIKSSSDFVERMVIVGIDGAGRELRRRSFEHDPTELSEDVEAIYLCHAVSADRPDVPYVLIDTGGSSDDKARLMCRRSDFGALHSLLRMGGKGGVIWRGNYVEQSRDILSLNENDYEFENGILSSILDQTVNFLTGPKAEKLRSWGLPPKRGVILYGRPGNGKTILSRLCAKYALQTGINVVIIEGKRRSRYSYESENMGFGDELKQAAARGPALLLFEDVDLHCPPRPANLDEQKGNDNSNLAELLEFLDGVVVTKGYALIATTNYIDRLDPALARSGRLEEQFEVGEPIMATRVRVLEKLLEIGPRPKPDVVAVAKLLEGASFADLAEVARRFKIAAAFNESAKPGALLDRAARELALERGLTHFDRTTSK